MVNNLQNLCVTAVFIPLLTCMIAGFFRNQIGRVGAHSITILGLAISLVLSGLIAKGLFLDGLPTVNQVLYHWGSGGKLFKFGFDIGLLIDQLTAVMMVVVNFISFLVHIYSIGYMADDDGYQRFFSYMSLFTFFMLMLVTANNGLQLFFGWEGVGLVSYLLIGFWFQRESAIQGSLKAFLVNRVGDFGFLLGLAVLFVAVGSIDYAPIFAKAPSLANQQWQLLYGFSCSTATLASVLLFVGAMGKSAQVPLHVWLPESMEGPTPISALIHAATMVTAGVFMVARMSPLFEYSNVALNLVLVIGATGALFTGLIGVVMNDIKRVVAYSTLSQLGYMMVAMGASAYSVGIFHLATHACFKALLFLGAGSVIIAMHHEQDMQKMGGLWKKMPITYVTCVIGSLALAAVPPFAGYFSKDMIIDAAKQSTLPGAHYAYFCVTTGAFVTGLYTFRALFLTFHMEPRMDAKTASHVKESPWVVWLPLVLLAIPSALLGAYLIGPMLFDKPALLGQSVMTLKGHPAMAHLAAHYHGVEKMMEHAPYSVSFWMAIGGIVSAWLSYIALPWLPAFFAKRFSILYKLFLRKFGFDDFNEQVLMRGTRGLGECLFQIADKRVIDGIFVNGTGLSVRWVALKARVIQTGYLFHYAFAMVLALFVFLSWFLLR